MPETADEKAPVGYISNSGARQAIGSSIQPNAYLSGKAFTEIPSELEVTVAARLAL
jgi:hypothetical protein